MIFQVETLAQKWMNEYAPGGGEDDEVAQKKDEK